MSEAFAACWQAAGKHLQWQGQGAVSWLKANLNPPFLEHLSFRLGNQLFFVRLEEDEGELVVPGSRRGLITIADGCKGHACLMPMRRDRGSWCPVAAGWGLLDASGGRPLDPVSFVSDERIEMTDWELQDFAVQVVCDQIKGLGRKLMSWQGNPFVDPSLWFTGEHGPEWVVVRAVRYPESTATPLPTGGKLSNAPLVSAGLVISLLWQ